jgi:enoyl-CoA hydratase/carnithine racemase
LNDSPILLELADGVAILTMNAPQRRNAISTAMRMALREQLGALSENDAVHAIVLTGAGGHFCAGGDITEMAPPGQPADPVLGRRRLVILHDIVRLLTAGSKPVVAAVDGFAFGAGLSLAMACDWVVAAEDARFAAAFGKIGLVADCGLLWTLPQRVGLPQTKDLLLTARTVDAPEAHAMGLVDAVVPKGQAVAAALQKVAQYRVVAPRALAATKAVMARRPTSLDELLEVEADVGTTLGLSRDHEEARRAFLEKRAPIFTGR